MRVFTVSTPVRHAATVEGLDGDDRFRRAPPLADPGPGGSSRQSERDRAFETFYRAEVDGVYRALALALADHQLAEEATHEGMARAYQRWSRIARYDRPAGWVYRVGLNWARSRLRKTGREVLTRQPEVDPPPESDLDPDLRRALAALTVDARTVVVLRYLLEWSTADTAAALGIAPGTVKSRLARALERMETLLDDRLEDRLEDRS